MNDKLKFIKELCDERLISNEFVEKENVIRIYPNSFDKSTLTKADLWEYVFKIKNPRLDTRHHYSKVEGEVRFDCTDIYVV